MSCANILHKYIYEEGENFRGPAKFIRLAWEWLTNRPAEFQTDFIGGGSAYWPDPMLEKQARSRQHYVPMAFQCQVNSLFVGYNYCDWLIWTSVHSAFNLWLPDAYAGCKCKAAKIEADRLKFECRVWLNNSKGLTVYLNGCISYFVIQHPLRYERLWLWPLVGDL